MLCAIAFGISSIIEHTKQGGQDFKQDEFSPECPSLWSSFRNVKTRHALGTQRPASEQSMLTSIETVCASSPVFRHALLTSEKKRIVGVIAFVAFFAVLAAVRIFVLGSAMSRSGLVVSALVIAFELMLFRAVNQALRSDADLGKSVWYFSTALECLFPALGVAYLVSSRLLPDYRPLATPWVLAFFP